VALWEWIRRGSISKEVVSRHASRGAGTYGTRYDYDTKLPTRTERFQSHGIEWSDLQAIIDDMETPDTPTTITAINSGDWTGTVTNLSWEPIEGTELFTADLTLFDPSGGS